MNLLTFNASSTAPTVTSIIQTTISSRNPNKRIEIYYEKLGVHINYRTQPITSSTMVPPSFLGHKDVITWSPFLYGSDVPLAPDLSTTTSQDIQADIVSVNVRASGIVRWQVGTISGKYHINVNCPTNIYFRKKDGAYIASPTINYPFLEKCHDTDNTSLLTTIDADGGLPAFDQVPAFEDGDLVSLWTIN
uniref:NDR1/HIN1-like protein 1 n=1 Tax=Tanacetum cinerariifolium TaxID=118510 RepID=A0A699JK63_TANCI|nr:NDR1/HIN1-like protein 1 [Tanacetum cinerariifolium]